MGRLLAVGVALLVLVLGGSGCSSDGGADGSQSATAGAGGSAAPTVAGDFSSAVYGYTALAPGGWSVEPSSSQWDGGDVDHTASYADRFDGQASGFIFTLGSPADDPLPEFAEGHVSWVKANRGCQQASDPVNSVLDGVPAVRVALAAVRGSTDQRWSARPWWSAMGWA